MIEEWLTFEEVASIENISRVRVAFKAKKGDYEVIRKCECHRTWLIGRSCLEKARIDRRSTRYSGAIDS